MNMEFKLSGLPDLKDAKPLFWFVMGFFLFVLLRNAWVSDDAYISFRTVFNFTEGHGLVYNLDERVQTFTNPLWVLLVSVFYFFTDEAYFTSLFLSIGLTLGGAYVFTAKISDWQWKALLGLGLLMLSKSFIDYSTSGLENPLNHFLLIVFAGLFLRMENGSRKLVWMSLVAALGVMNRMDTLLLYAPALAVVFWQVKSWKNVLWVAAGFSPFVLWELFSVVYYGFPFPNTAYAKLNTGIPGGELFTQALGYYVNSLDLDPVTLLTIAAAVIVTVFGKHWKILPLSLGIVLYLLYILKVGGDFMSGRFFAAPFLLSVIVLSQVEMPKLPRMIMTGGLLLVGITGPACPLFTHSMQKPVTEGKMDERGIADERLWYEEVSGLNRLNRQLDVLKAERQLDENRDPKEKRTLLWFDTIGFTGYRVGPSMHVADKWALADPLMARLPMAYRKDWRIGHFTRHVPEGYIETLRSGENQIKDYELSEYYRHLTSVIRGPVWSMDRFKEIWRFNTRQHEYLIDREFYRYPSISEIDARELSNPLECGTAWDAPGTVRILKGRPLFVEFGGVKRGNKVEISFDNNDSFELIFEKNRKFVGAMEVPAEFIEQGGLNVYRVKLPKAVRKKGFDRIIIEVTRGDGYASVGHVKVLD